MKSSRILSLLCVGTLSAGTLGFAAAVANPIAAEAATDVTITPNPAYASAEAFEGWGTSLVWFANATGGYPEDVRQELLEKVFGEDGLNLNIARYNIGGGNATDVPSYLRPGGAVEGWWNPDLGESDDEGEITSTYGDRERYAAAWDADNPDHYNLDADATQRWWVDALKNEGITWEAFSNSPPYFLTQSGYSSGGINNGSSEQLAPEDMDAFAGYLVTAVEHLESTYGIDIETLDPFNEPNTNYWSTSIPNGSQWPTSASRQEGAHIGPSAQNKMIQALASRLAEPDTSTDVSISAMDETNPSTFVTNWNGWSDESKASVDQLNVHTYGTSDRMIVRDIAKASDKPLWMSEVEGNWDTTGGFNLTNIDNGIGMASRIVDDLRELEPEAWVFWQPVEDLYNMEKTENSNWGSVLIDFDCDDNGDSERRIADNEPDPSCEVLTNAKYNTVRNFTHYILPGDHLIPTNDAQTTAAVAADGESATLVHVNSEAATRTVTIDLSGFGDIASGATVTPITTTESPVEDVTANALIASNPVAINANTKTATVSVPAKSVTTFVIDGVSGVSDEVSTFTDGETYQLLGVQSGKALAANGDAVQIASSATTPDAASAQAWTVRTLSGAGTNRQRITLENGNGQFLAVSGTSTTLVSTDEATAAADESMQWIPSTSDGRTYSLLSPTAERVLDVNGQSSADGAGVGTWTSNNGGNQRWTLASTAVQSAVPVNVSTITGEAPELPGTVTLTYRGGVERSAAVEWDVEDADWSTPGTVTISGHGVDMFGATFDSARAKVEIGSYTGTRPVSLTIYAGATLDRVQQGAPTTVPAELTPGGATFEANVEWDWTGLADTNFAETGTVTVPGSAESNDPTAPRLPATLTVIVTTAEEANVAPSSTASATFTESSSYSVDRTKNGLTTDKGWSNWRSGTKNARDTLSYTLAQTTQVRHLKVHFYRDGGTTWAQTLRIDHRTDGGEWVEGDSVAVAAPETGAPVVDVPLGDVAADEVRVVLTARAATHMVVSEVEIFGLQASESGVADLARISLDGVAVADFAADRLEYSAESTGSRWPVLSAVAVDGDANVSVVQPADADGQGRVDVTAPDGTVRSYTVGITRTVDLAVGSIAGDARVGSTLNASVSTVDPDDAELAYQWTRDGENISDATGAAYMATSEDIGAMLRVGVTASAAGFTSATAMSEPVTVEAAPEPTPEPTTPAPEPSAPAPTTSPSSPSLPSTGAASAPSVDALTAALRGKIGTPTEVVAGQNVTIRVGEEYAGDSMDVWLFSTPRHLGTVVVSASGEVTVRIPADVPAGDHRIVVTDASGAVIGWNPLRVNAAGDLAVTGGVVAPVLPFAIMLLALGGLIAVVRVRRRAGISTK
ncbi:O-glycosyl hydrolase [Microbacterium halimionae]|uniref:O-glycosyl hydrolase n=1 Tax=Microbacterium halimionae TaxID=1526413 RepID=A0A7W3PKK3_9MICO|nr:glycoside hydrolase [Microbacterium halimionae]MBA8815203.1 O-glycosyl hydrolase [Microbacterium halimionae]NII94006.1 O-glycosyl hydrolase [Microbacterium halimionae]